MTNTFTVVFKGNVRKLGKNPLKLATEFGQVVAVADGDKIDKADGLECDLYSAVLVAYRRGAREWAALNYPDWLERLKADDADCTHPACPLKQGQCAWAGGRTERFEDCPHPTTER